MATAVYETKGFVQFPVDAEPRQHEFVVSVTDDKLRIWVQDAMTYEEWQTLELGLHDFVTINTAIPQAKIKDYAARIGTALSRTTEEAALGRSLSKPAPDNSRILFVAFVLQVMDFRMTLEYTFHLLTKPVDHTKRLVADKEMLKTHVSALTAEKEKLLHRVATLVAERRNLNLSVSRLTEENTKLTITVARLLTESAGGSKSQPVTQLVSLEKESQERQVEVLTGKGTGPSHRTRTDGTGTEVKAARTMTAARDRKVCFALVKLGVTSIPGVQEVNFFKADGRVLHFADPMVQASITSNTFAVTGHSVTKSLQELLADTIN